MTKLQYIDFIRNSLPMVDKTSKYHRLQVEAAINVAVNTVFYDMYEKNPKKFKKSMERYSLLYSPLSVNPALSGTTGRYESALLIDIVDLPKKAGGVLEIMPDTAVLTTTVFVPVSTLEGEQIYGSESSLPGNVIGFSFSGGRTIEYWDMSAAQAAQGVVVRLIQQFKSYSNTDNVLLPYGQNKAIIDLVREFMGAIPPKDLVNTNADVNG